MPRRLVSPRVTVCSQYVIVDSHSPSHCHHRSRFRSILLVVIVEKSKKCLDFSVTLFMMHLLISIWYGGFPRRMEWWIVHIAATITMIVLGEYLCSRRELDEIPLLTL
jgi:Integral membrane protein S linking to the trans Golgi network